MGSLVTMAAQTTYRTGKQHDLQNAIAKNTEMTEQLTELSQNYAEMKQDAQSGSIFGNGY